MPDDVKSKRESERHPLEFKVNIFTFSGTEKHLVERVGLKDISGSGACFTSNHPRLYAVGQKIFMDISMPGTCEADVHMEGKATVIWIKDVKTDEAGQSSQTSVGVSMDNLLSFQQHPRDTDGGKEKSGDAA